MTDFDALEPRIKRMLQLIVKNRAAICEPAKGELTLHFNGRHVEAHLSGRLVLDDANGEPPKPAA